MRRGTGALGALSLVVALACGQPSTFDPANPAVGPGQFVGNGDPVSDGIFEGGDDVLPAPRQVAPPDDSLPPNCDAACESFCEQAGLENPVNRGLCRSLWGVGLDANPIDREEACRRLFVDMLGQVPTQQEMESQCAGEWGTVVRRLLDDDRFVFVNQRRMADAFLYSNEVVSAQAIYDMDNLVGKTMRGRVPWDLFAQVASAHPVLTRRHADARDKVEAVFRHFLGRPPFENERADMARLYNVWFSGYYDHPLLNLRMPDAFLRYPCLDEEGEVDANARGQCTSVLWGYNELILEPDFRATRAPQSGELVMWSGLMTAEEWAKVQVPGRILARDLAFWERAVENVLVQYLGYDLALMVPEVQRELVAYLLEHNGDIRSVHFAVATSAAYLQSYAGPGAAAYRWTWGPMKQLDAEVWMDSLSRATGFSTASCDHRISQPEALVEAGSLSAYRVLEHSRWSFDEEGELDESYSEVARTLGGCPENVVGGRFKVVSILTTATQLNFVNELCDPAQDAELPGAPVASLLPSGMDARKAVTPEVAEQIAAHQYRLLVGRTPSSTELEEAAAAGAECALGRCSAEEFARPLCFALLSSAEMIFY